VEPTAAAFARIPDEQFLAILPALTGLDLRTSTDIDPLAGLSPFSLVLPAQPADSLADGPAGQVDLLIGTTTEEGRLYVVLQGTVESTEADLRAVAHGDTGLLGPDPAPARLAAEVHGAWVAFARTGNPGWDRDETRLFGSGREPA